MAKRFTDTDKYKNPFIRSLPGAYKLFWDYIYHNCNHAGIWVKDFEIAQIYIGQDMPINESEALRLFNLDQQRVAVIDNKGKWFIIPFINFQYGELKENNRVHSSVISILNKYQLLDNKGHVSPLQRAKDKDKDKAKSKDKDKDKESYGENKKVLMTEEEHQKLFDIHGVEKATMLIDTLDDGVFQKGYTYKSHFKMMVLRKNKTKPWPLKEVDEIMGKGGSDLEAFRRKCGVV